MTRPRRSAVMSWVLAIAGSAMAAVVVSGAETSGPADAGGAARYTKQTPLTVEEAIRAGKRRFDEPWSLRNDIEGVWGLGPTYNEPSCPACHRNAGASGAPAEGAEIQGGMIVRLSVPGRGSEGGPNPHPHYGDQLQNRGIANRVPREGRAFVRYETVADTYGDGEPIPLRRPVIEFSDLQFGDLGDVMVSARNAPRLFGLGLLEAVPESVLAEIARRQVEFGISGRLNRVWDVEAQRSAIGRFGWKASQPSLRQQIAAAFLNDIGATSTLYPADNCPPVQSACRTDPTTTDCGGLGGGCAGRLREEVLPSRLETMTLYLQALTLPDRIGREETPTVRGRALFTEARCAVCHVPALKTGPASAIPGQAGVTFHPYTDLLLHDMGDGLADGRPDYEADGREWRTAPLWGLGAQRDAQGHRSLLHDGRARSVAEAILWHGGEAAFSRESFRQMPRADREALVAFVESL